MITMCFKRVVDGGDYVWGDSIICSRGLRMLYDVPRSADKIWVDVATWPDVRNRGLPKGFYHYDIPRSPGWGWLVLYDGVGTVGDAVVLDGITLDELQNISRRGGIRIRYEA
jgi:hypothetical protein